MSDNSPIDKPDVDISPEAVTKFVGFFHNEGRIVDGRFLCALAADRDRLAKERDEAKELAQDRLDGQRQVTASLREHLRDCRMRKLEAETELSAALARAEKAEAEVRTHLGRT